MSRYIEAGYLIALGSLSAYAASIVARERAARSRLTRPRQAPGDRAPTTGSAGLGDHS